MITFNPENKDVLSYGECLWPTAEITDQADADQYFEAYVKYLQGWLEKEPRGDDVTAEEIARINIGYWTGYCSDEASDRMKKLFNCKHPIL